ncbi:hypothetical protein HNR59_003625 [Aquamicrobium lusatiense]|uniref:Uncharacterized protein n=1 Tax=Aquamicrobium lusatiense TaxID=89772 RepID=A0A7W9S500_9HYPH|nr:hypothetical protein [Aquamicrobium lusatiense]
MAGPGSSVLPGQTDAGPKRSYVFLRIPESGLIKDCEPGMQVRLRYARNTRLKDWEVS